MAAESVTGVLLVGGASVRYGVPKAHARFEGESLGERAWRVLGEAFDERIAFGKRDELELPFVIFDDGTEVRAPIAGVVAGLVGAPTELTVVLPVDCPLVTPAMLQALAAACSGVDAAVPQTGPLPGAYRKTALPVLQRRLAVERLSLRDALLELDTHTVQLDEELLANVNTAEDLRRLAGE